MLGVLLYAVHVWAGGDSKLLILVAFAMPARLYHYYSHEMFPTLSIVIFTFSVGYVYLMIHSLLCAVRKEKAYSDGNKKQAIVSFLHDFDVLEISDDGAVRVQFSEYWDDNTLFITSKCNSNCVMCPSSEYSRRAGVIPEESEIMELLRHFSPCAKHITITGGEPFLFRQSMFRVLEYCKETVFIARHGIMSMSTLKKCRLKRLKKLL